MRIPNPAFWRDAARRLAAPALVCAAVLSPTTAHAAAGHYVDRSTALQLDMVEGQLSTGATGVKMELTLKTRDADACAKLFPQQAGWRTMCRESVEKNWPVQVATSRRPPSATGVVTDRGGWKAGSVVIRVMLDASGAPFALAVSDSGSFTAALLLDGEQAAFDAADPKTRGPDDDAPAWQRQAFEARLNRDGVRSRVNLGPVSPQGRREAQLTFEIEPMRGKDCMRVTNGNRFPGWGRFCETADKVGPITLSGTLVPITGGGAYTGTFRNQATNRLFQIVVDPTGPSVARVGLREGAGTAPFTTRTFPEAVLYGAGNVEQGSSTIDNNGDPAEEQQASAVGPPPDDWPTGGTVLVPYVDMPAIRVTFTKDDKTGNPVARFSQYDRCPARVGTYCAKLLEHSGQTYPIGQYVSSPKTAWGVISTLTGGYVFHISTDFNRRLVGSIFPTDAFLDGVMRDR